jgi:hypothetical protein
MQNPDISAGERDVEAGSIGRLLGEGFFVPRFIQNGYADPMSFGQHYKKRTLEPGKRVHTPGLCLGITLSWIRKVHIHQNFEFSQIQNEGLPFEGMFMQYIAEHGYSTRSKAEIIDEQAYEAEIRSYALSVRPSQMLKRTNILSGLGRLGFIHEQKGDMVVFDIVNDLGSRKSRNGVVTYLLLGVDHAQALAVDTEGVAFFDPEYGTLIYTRDEAFRNHKLAGALRENISGSTYPGFCVIKVDY